MNKANIRQNTSNRNIGNQIKPLSEIFIYVYSSLTHWAWDSSLLTQKYENGAFYVWEYWGNWDTQTCIEPRSR